MEWFQTLFATSPTGWSILLISIVATVGLALASINFRGIGLGVTGVLFAGLFFGHLGFEVNHEIVDFVREFGLILFVFTIGLQIGPGFFASLRSQGLALNGLAAAVVILGGLATVGCALLFDIPFGSAAGIFSGSTTNTPSLGAAQQALAGIGASPEVAGIPALSYAVTYPLAIAGIIVGMLIIRAIFRIDITDELRRHEEALSKNQTPIEVANLVIENPNLDGMKVEEIPGIKESGIVLSRLKRKCESEASAVTGTTILRCGDIVVAVGSPEGVEDFQQIVGSRSTENIISSSGNLIVQRVIVTRKAVLGKTLRQLAIGPTHGVSVTRLRRGGVEMTANQNLKLQFGDVLNLVGEASALREAGKVVGNTPKDLDDTNYIPVFFGIALGILVGGLPIAMPGLPVPVRLGLAGGPLILAIILSRVGNIGRLVWYMPANVNHALRELGIVLFLACVGLKSGGSFAETLLSQDGLLWLVCGVGVTMIPILIVASFARGVLKLNYMTIIGLMSGSMTDPPALAFANTIAGSQAPAVAYAGVYPLTMLLRITTAQVIVLALAA